MIHSSCPIISEKLSHHFEFSKERWCNGRNAASSYLRRGGENINLALSLASGMQVDNESPLIMFCFGMKAQLNFSANQNLIPLK